MARKRRTQHPSPEPAPHRPRTLGTALADALPDAIACGACLLAWVAPRAIGGVDLIAYAAPLFGIQLPMALIGLFAGVSRIDDRSMSRATKAGFVLAPALTMALFAPALLGAQALLGVLWLSALSLWRIADGTIDREAPVQGAWITYQQGEDEQGRPLRSYAVSTGGSPPMRGGRVRQWRVEAGHSQVMASLTAMAGLVLCFLLPFVDVERLGVTPEIEAASAWSATALGQVVGAHFVLAGGVALFAARVLLHFEGIEPARGSRGTAPVPRIEDDPVLREIVDRIDRKPRR
jgi:hypothetical protein